MLICSKSCPLADFESSLSLYAASPTVRTSAIWNLVAAVLAACTPFWTEAAILSALNLKLKSLLPNFWSAVTMASMTAASAGFNCAAIGASASATWLIADPKIGRPKKLPTPGVSPARPNWLIVKSRCACCCCCCCAAASAWPCCWVACAMGVVPPDTMGAGGGVVSADGVIGGAGGGTTFVVGIPEV